MKLNKIYKPSADELFAKAMQDAELRGPNGRVITFYDLPKIVQDKILSRWPYENVREVVELPINKDEDETVFVGGPQAQKMFVIHLNDPDGQELAFWPNGNSIEWVEEDERFPEEGEEEDGMTDEELDEYHQQYEQELRRLLDDARSKNERHE